MSNSVILFLLSLSLSDNILIFFFCYQFKLFIPSPTNSEYIWNYAIITWINSLTIQELGKNNVEETTPSCGYFHL